MRAVPLALLLLLGVATAALAAPPKEAQFEVEGVEYLYIAGVNYTDSAELVGHGGLRPIESCAFIQLHPGTPNGVVRVIGLEGVVDSVEARVDQLRDADGGRGYDYDLGVTEDGLARTATVAFGGNATLRVREDLYYDPVSSTGDAATDRRADDLRASVAVLQQGTRDDLSNAIVGTQAPAEDEELHIHVRSSGKSAPASIVTTYGSGGNTPPTSEYGYATDFLNLKYGGTGRLDISASASVPAGLNTYDVAVVSPSGELLGTARVEPALLADDTASIDFPLEEFGNYRIVLTGDVMLSQWSMTLTQRPPEDFDLHFWYDNVTYGAQAYQDYRACKNEISSANSIVASEAVVGRPRPPQFHVVYVALAVVGVVAVSAIAIKLASDQVSASAFRKAK